MKNLRISKTMQLSHLTCAYLIHLYLIINDSQYDDITWNGTLSEIWTPNDRYGNVHGIFNQSYWNKIPLSKGFILSSVNFTNYYEYYDINIFFTIFFACSLDLDDKNEFVVLLNDITKIDFNATNFESPLSLPSATLAKIARIARIAITMIISKVLMYIQMLRNLKCMKLIMIVKPSKIRSASTI